jgi:ComF family protein
VAIVLAPACAACRLPLDEPTRGAVCGRCWSAIVPITPPCCRTCGEPLKTWRLPPDHLRQGYGGQEGGSHVIGGTDEDEDRCLRCQQTEPVIALARSVGSYEGAMREIVHALKYDRRPSLARHLARRMRSAGADVLAGADIVVPVPLHRSRQRERGFNQARQLARHLGLPVAGALVRTRKTAAQADLPASKRQANVRGAFVARRALVEGLRIVLVDDVSTTGATLNACAAALLDAGAKEVRALTAAKAVARRP